MERTPTGLAVRDSGVGEPILCIHGSLVADSFEAMVHTPDLDRYRMIRYHRRGMGESRQLVVSTSLRQHVGDAVSVLDHCGVDCAHVVGHSFGGLVAAQLGLDHADRVRSLTLLEPVLRSPDDAAATYRTMLLPLVELHGAGSTDQALELFAGVAFGADWTDRLEVAIAGSVDQVIRDAHSLFDGDLPAMEHRTLERAEHDRLGSPVLVMTGSDGFPLDESYLGTVAPGAEHRVVDGVNHAMQITTARPFATAVAEMAERHPIV